VRTGEGEGEREGQDALVDTLDSRPEPRLAQWLESCEPRLAPDETEGGFMKTATQSNTSHQESVQSENKVSWLLENLFLCSIPIAFWDKPKGMAQPPKLRVATISQKRIKE
jgi:hypothetical protein